MGIRGTQGHDPRARDGEVSQRQKGVIPGFGTWIKWRRPNCWFRPVDNCSYIPLDQRIKLVSCLLPFSSVRVSTDPRLANQARPLSKNQFIINIKPDNQVNVE